MRTQRLVARSLSLLRRVLTASNLAACVPAALLVCALAPAHARAADDDMADRVYLPAARTDARFDLLEPSYFITSNGSNAPGDSLTNNNQVRLRIALRYRMGDLSEEIKAIPGDWRAHLYFAFTQDAFWNLYDESAPFYDTNFAPESFLYLRQKSWPFGAALGVKHQSNGRDGDVSRSWNRYYAMIGWGQPRINAFYGTVAAWKTWGIAAENPDIKDFRGRGEAVLYFVPGALWTPTILRLDQFGFIFRVPMGGKPFFPSFEGSLLFRLQKEALFSPSVMVQYFGGVGHMLRDYNRNESVWRVGLAMSR